MSESKNCDVLWRPAFCAACRMAAAKAAVGHACVPRVTAEAPRRRVPYILDNAGEPTRRRFAGLAHARLVLSHVSQREAALAQMAAALKPDGWLVIEEQLREAILASGAAARARSVGLARIFAGTITTARRNA